MISTGYYHGASPHQIGKKALQLDVGMDLEKKPLDPVLPKVPTCNENP